MTGYDVWLLHPSARYPLALVSEFESLEYSKVVNDLGAFSLTLPGYFDVSLLAQDTRVVIMRKPDGGVRYLEFAGLIEDIERHTQASSNGGSEVVSAMGYDLNSLLNRRIVAYAAASAQAQKTDQADDMLKAMARENLGSSAIAARDLTAAGFTVAADVGLGTSLTKGFSWQNLLLAMQGVSESSHSTETTSAYFGIVPLNIGDLCEFRTNILQWGSDRRLNSASAVVFTLSTNISEAQRIKDYRSERNHAYAGGQGEEAARVIQESEDLAREGASLFNRREVFVDARNETDVNAVLAAARSAVQAGAPRNFFSGQIINLGQYVYGRDFNHGDYVTAIYKGERLDCRIDTVHVQVSRSGGEQVQFNMQKDF